MSANEIHLNDIGTIFEVTVMDGAAVVDVSTATTKEFIFRKPDLSTVTKAAAFSTNGVDGKLKYTFLSGDLDQTGVWFLQAHIVLPTGAWRSDQLSFSVFPNL